jgi:putative oxidoreductase
MNTTSLLATNHPHILDFIQFVLRVWLGGLIFAHGYNKMFRGGKIAGTAGWFASIGMKPGLLNAYAASLTEMGCGFLLIIGFLTTLASAGLIAVMLVALWTAHRKNGFFIFNANGGGVEFVGTVAVAALVTGTIGAGAWSLDHKVNLTHWNLSQNLLITAAVGVGGAILQLLAFYRPSK